jgi:hypothetical protein
MARAREQAAADCQEPGTEPLRGVPHRPAPGLQSRRRGENQSVLLSYRRGRGGGEKGCDVERRRKFEPLSALQSSLILPDESKGYGRVCPDDVAAWPYMCDQDAGLMADCGALDCFNRPSQDRAHIFTAFDVDLNQAGG